MRGRRRFGSTRRDYTSRRTLNAEQLEKRELLAADWPCAGVPIGPGGDGGVCQADSTLADFENCVPQVNESANMSRTGRMLRGRDAGLVGPHQAEPVGAGDVSVRAPLSDAEAEGLITLREEEKLARDVYLALADVALVNEWDAPIFANIAQAESRHMDAVGRLIVNYDLEDPVGEQDVRGEFVNEVFAQLYSDLVAVGSGSLIQAYKVGAMIEEMDIKDLQETPVDEAHSDLERVYGNLHRGSRNHLRAFDAQIEAAGETYEAQFLDQDEFDAIADSPSERGKGPGRQGQRGRAAAADQTGDVDETLRLHGRFGQGETGRQTRVGDGDRGRDCTSQDGQACDTPQKTSDRNRLFARLGAQRGTSTYLIAVYQ